VSNLVEVHTLRASIVFGRSNVLYVFILMLSYSHSKSDCRQDVSVGLIFYWHGQRDSMPFKAIMTTIRNSLDCHTLIEAGMPNPIGIDRVDL
jgi:hypothetical protein